MLSRPIALALLSAFVWEFSGACAGYGRCGKNHMQAIFDWENIDPSNRGQLA